MARASIEFTIDCTEAAAAVAELCDLIKGREHRLPAILLARFDALFQARPGAETIRDRLAVYVGTDERRVMRFEPSGEVLAITAHARAVLNG